MNEFDRRIKQKVQSYLNENISFSEKEVTNIQEKLQKRRRMFNSPYIYVLSMLSIVLFLSIMPFIQNTPTIDFSTVPYSSKSALEKEQPLVRERIETEEEIPLKEGMKGEEQEEETMETGLETETETEEEKEAIFLELLDKYNKLRDYEINYDGNDVSELDKSTGYHIGYRVIGFNTKQKFLAQFSNFATINALTKMFDFIIETDKGLYLVPTEHYIYPFDKNEDYQLNKVEEQKYQISQTVTRADAGGKSDFTVWFEFTKIDEKWLITDWKSTREITYDPEPKIDTEILNQLLYTLGQYNDMDHSYFEISDELYNLKNGKKAYKVLNIDTEIAFYHQFHVSVSREVAEKIWRDYVMVQDGEIFLLPSKGKFYYPKFDENRYEVKELQKGKYQITQTYSNTNYSDIEDAIYNIQFIIENINDFYVITDLSYSVEE